MPGCNPNGQTPEDFRAEFEARTASDEEFDRSVQQFLEEERELMRRRLADEDD